MSKVLATAQTNSYINFLEVFDCDCSFYASDCIAASLPYNLYRICKVFFRFVVVCIFNAVARAAQNRRRAYASRKRVCLHTIHGIERNHHFHLFFFFRVVHGIRHQRCKQNMTNKRPCKVQTCISTSRCHVYNCASNAIVMHIQKVKDVEKMCKNENRTIKCTVDCE